MTQSEIAIQNQVPGVAILSIPPASASGKDGIEVIKLLRTITKQSLVDAGKSLEILPYHYPLDEIILAHREHFEQSASSSGKLYNIEQEITARIKDQILSKLEGLGVKTQLIEPKTTMSYDSVPRLIAKLMNNENNIMLYGPKGCGKSAMAEQACKHLGYIDENGDVDSSRVKYFSMATLHPEDFVGIPAPDTTPGNEGFFRYLMLHGLLEAEILILDEFNRAHPKVVNGVMQILHGRAINDMKLPNLKSVVAMINPPEDGEYHGTEELDEAIVDRFDHFIEIAPNVNAEYFALVLGNEHVANSLVEWYSELDAPARKQISPRRLEKIGQAFLHGETIGTSLYRKKCSISLHLLEKRLKSLDILTLKEFVSNPAKVIEDIKADPQKGQDIMFRCRELINQLHRSGDAKGMAAVAPIFTVFSRDFLKSINRQGSLMAFVSKSVEKYATKEVQMQVVKDFADRAAGSEDLENARKIAAEKLASNVDAKSMTI